MIKKIHPREPHGRPNYEHPFDHPPTPPHWRGGIPHPPHIRSSRIRLAYDDDTISHFNQLYGNAEYVLEILETCPPEIKLTLAMLFGIQVSVQDYPQETHPMVRFETPFLTDSNTELLKQVLECDEPMIAMRIYNACPPEQTLLALAIASLIKNEVEA